MWLELFLYNSWTTAVLHLISLFPPLQWRWAISDHLNESTILQLSNKIAEVWIPGALDLPLGWLFSHCQGRWECISRWWGGNVMLGPYYVLLEDQRCSWNTGRGAGGRADISGNLVIKILVVEVWAGLKQWWVGVEKSQSNEVHGIE